jgi:hypothetical protein
MRFSLLKVEKFIFAGVDYLSELSIYPPEMFLVQPAKDGSGPTQIIEKEKLSKRKDSSKKKFRKNLDHSRAGSIHSHHQHKGEADDVDDEDLHDEMRNQFQPKMSLPLS